MYSTYESWCPYIAGELEDNHIHNITKNVKINNQRINYFIDNIVKEIKPAKNINN